MIVFDQYGRPVEDPKSLVYCEQMRIDFVENKTTNCFQYLLLYSGNRIDAIGYCNIADEAMSPQSLT